MATEFKSSGSSLDEKHDLERNGLAQEGPLLLEARTRSITRAHSHLIYPSSEPLDVANAHFDDPNLDRANLGDLEEDSPYPEVRSAVANTDDVDMPVNTIRVWILGMIMAIIIPGLNQFLWVQSFSGRITVCLSYSSSNSPARREKLLPVPIGHGW